MKQLRKLLFPFSALYYVAIWVRNALYDLGILKSITYDFPVICVGNLSTGGTGKTPLTEYLIRLLHKRTPVGVLSRGYGRKTKGFIRVMPSHTALEVGDEPLQYATRFDAISVAVCEDRREGIFKMRDQEQAPQTIVLDDAFQHRKVKAGFSVVLMTYSEPFYEDYVLPVGNLRDLRNQARRAQAIVVTKCPNTIGEQEKESIRYKIAKYTRSPVYFARIVYDDFILYANEKQVSWNHLNGEEITLLTGIANPKPLIAYLKEKAVQYTHMNYGDHHNFTTRDIEILQKCSCIITTEKDYMRLQSRLKNPTIFYVRMEMDFLEEDGFHFDQSVLTFLKS